MIGTPISHRAWTSRMTVRLDTSSSSAISKEVRGALLEKEDLGGESLGLGHGRSTVIVLFWFDVPRDTGRVGAWTAPTMNNMRSIITTGTVVKPMGGTPMPPYEAFWISSSVMRMGASLWSMTPAGTMTRLMSSVLGTSYITSIITCSIIALRARAPVLRLMAS